MNDPAMLSRLDSLDNLVFDTTHSPLGRDRLRLPRADFDFLLTTIGANDATQIERIDAIFARTVTFSDSVTIKTADLTTLIHMVRVIVGVVSVDEAIQRG